MISFALYFKSSFRRSFIYMYVYVWRAAYVSHILASKTNARISLLVVIILIVYDERLFTP